MQLSIFVRLYGTYVQRRENGPFFARPFFSGKWQQNWAWFILKSHCNLGGEDHYITSVVPAYEYATVQWKFDQMKLVGKSVREILSCRCTFLQISLCFECFELLWMLGNVLNVVKYCECCKMSGNCDKKSKSRKKLEWSIHDEMQRNLKFSSLTKVIPWTARLSSWSKTRNPSILDILQWDDWTMIWSSRRLMVQCLFW